jgi:hypothetical protein
LFSDRTFGNVAITGRFFCTKGSRAPHRRHTGGVSGSGLGGDRGVHIRSATRRGRCHRRVFLRRRVRRRVPDLRGACGALPAPGRRTGPPRPGRWRPGWRGRAQFRSLPRGLPGASCGGLRPGAGQLPADGRGDAGDPRRPAAPSRAPGSCMSTGRRKRRRSPRCCRTRNAFSARRGSVPAASRRWASRCGCSTRPRPSCPPGR